MTKSRPVLWAIALVVCSLRGTLAAEPIDTTLCELVANPAAFSGKMVRVRAKVVTGFEVAVVLAECDHKGVATALEYPGGVEDSDRTDFSLLRDENFKRFEQLLREYSPLTMCIEPCPEKPKREGSVVATLVGRFDGPDKLTITDSTGKKVVRKGYGALPGYNTRLILKAVSDVTIGK